MINFLNGMLFVTGLCLAMNEGAWFPWANMVGCLVMGISTGFLKRGIN